MDRIFNASSGSPRRSASRLDSGVPSSVRLSRGSPRCLEWRPAIWTKYECTQLRGFFKNTIFVSSHTVPREPRRDPSNCRLYEQMNMGYDIYPTQPGIELTTCSIPSAYQFLQVTVTDFAITNYLLVDKFSQKFFLVWTYILLDVQKERVGLIFRQLYISERYQECFDEKTRGYGWRGAAVREQGWTTRVWAQIYVGYWLEKKS